MATFDSNRVGPGTFQLVRDASTGTYSLKEVGFTKLPSLTLPDLSSTTTTQTQTQTQDQTETDTTDQQLLKLPEVGEGDSDETFSKFPTPDNRQDLTGEKTFENIQQQATNIGRADMGIQMEDISAGSDNRRALAKYNEALANYNRITELNRDRGMGKQPVSSEQQLDNEANLRDAIADVNNARKNYEDTIVNIGAAPIGDFSKGPRTVPTGTLTGAKTATTPIAPGTFTKESIDKSFLGEEGTDPNIFNKAKDVISNTKPVQLLGIGLKMGTEALVNLTTSPQQQALNRSNKDALSSLGYKTRGELGGSTDPGRIAGNPADNVFAGMNAQSARGNIMTGSANRIKTRETVGIQRVEKRYGKDSQQAKDFRDKTEKFKEQRQAVLDAKEKKQAEINKKTMNQGPAGQGGGGSSSGGKSIVCTAMYQTTGLQDWAKAMKIWYIYQKRYLTIQHQEGYHKLFKPFVKAMHKSNIIKAIGAHFAKYRTQHLKHVLFKSKPSMLGKVYSKTLETICY